MNRELRSLVSDFHDDADRAIADGNEFDLVRLERCIDPTRTELLGELSALITRAQNEDRDMRASESREADELKREIEQFDLKADQVKAAAARSGRQRSSTFAAVPTGGSHSRRGGRQPWAEVRDWNNPTEVRGRVEDTAEVLGFDDTSAKRATWIAEKDGEFARNFVARSDPNYRDAFLKLLQDPQNGHMAWSPAERDAVQRAVVVGTDTSGGYGVPTMLDPTLILTNDGADNLARDVFRTVTLRDGNEYVGISTAGVTASWDDELEEVSDDSPTLGEVRIPVHKAQAFVPYSIEASQDIRNLEGGLRMALQDAKDRLEAAAFMTGSGTGEPTGLFTAVYADTNSRVQTTTAATVGLVDLHAVYRALPQRFRPRAAWFMNPLWLGTIRQLGSAVGASFTGDLREALPEKIIGKPVYESDDAPELQTTTALDNITVFGDPMQYVIVDKAGMSIELIPNLMGTTNNRPIGARALYAHWRVGAEPTTTAAWRVLVDKTSA